MKNIELLAPVGNQESLYSAIYNGADAIYLGLSNFNARANAQNFDNNSIRDVTKLAHLYGVKVYVTINTLINDGEFPEFLDMVKSAVEAKVDAYIIQDIGVASILKSAFPNIVMHASTQMGIHNLDGAIQAQKLGFTRVVLSREVKLEDIKLIKQHTNLELEYFVQGALCVAFSGNCYFSSLCHAKSGNRGKCLQLCRLPYSYDKKKFAYYLSPADLSLMKSLQELIDAGVQSFKIEGRLRRPAYVAQSVQSYRYALDNLNNLNINYEKHLRYLAKVFNRGKYNERAYLDNGVPNNVINMNCNNHIGEPIGKVLSVQKFKNIYKIEISSSHNLSQFDGLKFFVDNQEVASIGVGNYEKCGQNYIIYSKHNPPKNSQVNLILDYQREQYLVNIDKKLEIDIIVRALIGLPLEININYNGIALNQYSNYTCEKAQNSPTTCEEITNQISKLNDTHFVIRNIEIETNGVFIPKSILNALRRDAITQLENKIIEENEKAIKAYINSDFELPNIKSIENYLNKNIALINNLRDLKIIPNDYIVAYAPLVYGSKTAQELEEINAQGFSVALNLPIIANSKDINIIENILTSLSFKPYLISNNLWGLKYAGAYNVIANYNHNVFNSYSSNYLISKGVRGVVQSIEDESTLQPNIHSYFGCPSLMTFCHCPYKTLRHSTCAKCEYNGDMTLYNQQQAKFLIRRTRLSQCYFELISNKIIKNKSQYFLIDLRSLENQDKNEIIKK